MVIIMARKNKIIFVLLAVIFIDSVGWGLVFPTLAPLLLDNSSHLLSSHFSYATRNLIFELIIAIYCLFMFLFSPILGLISDGIGRKKVLFIAMFGAATAFFICFLGLTINNLWLIILGRIVGGMTAGSFPIAQAAIIDISDQNNKSTFLGWIVLSNGIGFMCGPLLGGALQEIHIAGINPLALPFIIGGIMGCVGMILIYLFFNETFSTFQKVKINLFTSFANIYDAFFVMAKTKTYCLTMLFSMLGYVMFFTAMPLLLDSKFKLSGAEIGYVLSYFALIFSIGLIFVAPKLFKRFSLHKLVVTSIFVQVICYFPFALSSSIPYLLIYLAPISLAVPIMYVGIVTLISNSASELHQGKIMGVVGSIIAITWAIGPIFSGVSDQGAIVVCYFSAVALLLLSLLVFVLPNIPRCLKLINTDK